MTVASRLITCVALSLLPMAAQAAPKLAPAAPPLIEVVNKTKTPLDIIQGKWITVVLPGESQQVEDSKTRPLTIATKTREAAIRFVTLSYAKGCKAATCLLITGE
ncbi:hypothetical protein IFT48_16045 [Pseudomonas fluorescens]|uniref:hypothetical protein n=1 Tax=Pseudomonas fluorescens TaxID=294 RepID=UPI001902F054|nr:hypothetical protein [Pseudomonas fluorescens]MBD8091507.1 hypothetical protein [Pseudomonas fluorescens]MBD8716875.1 hypothetical protein [Pseudomonas fluorescens]